MSGTVKEVIRDILLGAGATLDGINEYVDHALAEIDAAGFVIAPKEPSKEMIEAGARASVDQIYYKDNAWERCVEDDCKDDWLNAAKFGYRAMVAAAAKANES